MENQTVYPYGQGGQLPSGYPIADDLNTNSAQQALSAKQGVVINEAVINPLTLIDLSLMPVTLGVIVSGNAWSGVQTNHESVTIPVTPGQKYRLTANGTNNSFYAFLTAVSPWSASGSLSFSSSQNGRVLVSSNTTVEFTIPSDTHYLYTAITNNGADQTPQIYLVETKENAARRREEELRNQIVGDATELCNYTTDSFVYNKGGRITKVGNSGYSIQNTAKTSGGYYLFTLPSGMEDGQNYLLSFDYKSWLSEDWGFNVANDTIALNYPIKGATIPASGSGHISTIYTYSKGDKYLRLASSSQNENTSLVIENLSIKQGVATIAGLVKRLNRVEDYPTIKSDSDYMPYDGKRIDTAEGRYTFGAYMSSLSTHQSAASYGDYMVTFTDKMTNIRLYNLVTQTLLATVTQSALDSLHHCNQSFFGTEKYDENDAFPLVYITVNNNGTTAGGYMEAYRIVPTMGSSDYESFSITLVQTVTLPVMSEQNALGNANFVLDKRSGNLYTYSRYNDSQASSYRKLRITKWAMPTLSQGDVTLTDSDILDSWETGTMAVNNQGAAIKNHLLFILRGSQSVGYITLSVFDLIQKTTVAIIDLLSDGFTMEPEGVFFWGNTLYVTNSTVYRFYFR